MFLPTRTENTQNASITTKQIIEPMDEVPQ
jgi:hypothetical protein